LTSAPVNILAIAGSMREKSFNRKALQIAKQIASELHAHVEELDLKTLDLPLFNEDLRADKYPESVEILKNAIAAADIVMIATPEYNNSVPGVLKNAIDWASDMTNPFEGKVAVIFGASNGMFGTLRAQLHLRQILTALSVELDHKIKQHMRQLIEATLLLAQRKQQRNNC
jgi:chromate reductase